MMDPFFVTHNGNDFTPIPELHVIRGDLGDDEDA